MRVQEHRHASGWPRMRAWLVYGMTAVTATVMLLALLTVLFEGHGVPAGTP